MEIDSKEWVLRNISASEWEELMAAARRQRLYIVLQIVVAALFLANAVVAAILLYR